MSFTQTTARGSPSSRTSIISHARLTVSQDASSIQGIPTEKRKRKAPPKTHLSELRHLQMEKKEKSFEPHWRMKEKTKTVSVALVLCLNIGVDPPDVIKPDPCARLECWLEPSGQQAQKSLENIGKTLQTQYERWHARAKYKLCLDPTLEDVKKLCLALRRNSKDERVLFHYNGRGVPKPTNNGEIWVFNKNYTQYIPLSIYELQTWMGSPSIYVFDCTSAGLIVKWFHNFIQQREKEYQYLASTGTIYEQPPPLKDFIILAACGPNESLPLNPALPADIFTSCLTTPIKIALRWYITLFKFPKGSTFHEITVDMVDKIPGRQNDRKTALGELNWIFTAITDTIAWNTLPRELFQKLFRQDLLVASLFRNFLLAERILRSASCTPISSPSLPPTHNHPMWKTWDFSVDLCLTQLPSLLNDPNYEYKHSPFFTEQLTAFELWLEFGREDKPGPEQLPIVLQVLLSQQHRLKALELLGAFLDLGPWAVDQALSVGIFPYVLKLLQSPMPELRQILVFIWAKILALDKSCQLDLIKDNGHTYFIQVLAKPHPSDQLEMSAFILSVIMSGCRSGQTACLQQNLMKICLSKLEEPDPMVRRWVVLCLGKLWEDFEDGKWAAVKENAPKLLCPLLTDPVPEVRASAIFALSSFLGGSDSNQQRVQIEMNIALSLMVPTKDASPLVRKELALALVNITRICEPMIKEIALEMFREDMAAEAKKEEERKRVKSKKLKQPTTPVSISPETDRSDDQLSASVHGCCWRLIRNLSVDPHPLVSKVAIVAVSYFNNYCMVTEGTKENPTFVNKQLKHLSSSNSMKRATSLPSFSQGGSPTESSILTTSGIGLNDSISSELNSSAEPPEPFETFTGIKSTFYVWCCEYFSNPILKPQQEDETSPKFLSKQRKQQKMEVVLTEAKTLTQSNEKRKFDDQIAFLDNEGEVPHILQFHPFEEHMVVADAGLHITTWSSEGAKLNKFRVPRKSGRITSMILLNEHDDTLLLGATDDSVIRIWKNYDSPTDKELVTAWKSFDQTSYIPKNRRMGVLVSWNQDSGLMVTSGDLPQIKIWDVSRELCYQEIPIPPEVPVTCLQNLTPTQFVAGCLDGSLRVYDVRASPRNSVVHSFNEHSRPIKTVQFPKYSTQIISGTVGGEIKIWDIRETTSSKTFELATKAVSAMAIHQYAPLIAAGSKENIRIVTFEGEELSLIRYYVGFLGQRISPVYSLSFHPYRGLLAAGATDSVISVYSMGKQL